MKRGQIILLGGEGLTIATGMLLAGLGGVVGVRLMTEALRPIEYGLLSLAMTGTTLMERVVFAGLSGSAIRFHAQALEAYRYRIFLAALGKEARNRLMLMVMIVMLICIVLAVTGNARYIPLTLLTFFYSSEQSLNAVIDGIQNAARQRVIVAFHRAAFQWLRFTLAVALIYLFQYPSSDIAMVGYMIAGAVILTSQYTFFNRRFRSLSEREVGVAVGELETAYG